MLASQTTLTLCQTSHYVVPNPMLKSYDLSHSHSHQPCLFSGSWVATLHAILTYYLVKALINTVSLYCRYFFLNQSHKIKMNGRLWGNIMQAYFTLYVQYIRSLVTHSLLIWIINAILADLHFSNPSVQPHIAHNNHIWREIIQNAALSCLQLSPMKFEYDLNMHYAVAVGS